MRLLVNNYLDDSTITATNEDSSYPVENIAHRFLEKRFQSNGSQSTITIEFPEDRDVSMIAIGFNNLTDSDDVLVLDKTATDTLVLDKTATDTRILQTATYYELKNNSSTVLQTGELEIGEDILTTYFTAIECRSIELIFASDSSEMLYIGGVGVGDPLEIEYIQVNPEMSIQQRVTQSVTDGGQSISRYRRDLENWSARVINETNAKRKEIVAAVRATRKPIFADLFPLNHTGYRPLYADVTAWGNFQRETVSDEYNTAISVEERR